MCGQSIYFRGALQSIPFYLICNMTTFKKKKFVTMYVTHAHKDESFLELRSEVKVTVNQKQCVTLCNPKMYPHTSFGVPISNNIGDMVRIRLFRTENRDQGHIDPKIICDTPRPKV